MSLQIIPKEIQEKEINEKKPQQITKPLIYMRH